jgi:hypothetical protein
MAVVQVRGRFRDRLALRRNRLRLTHDSHRLWPPVRKLMATPTVQENGRIANQAFMPESSAWSRSPTHPAWMLIEHPTEEGHMNIKSGLAVLAVCCAGALGIAQPAKADSFSVGYHNGYHGWHHGGYSVSFGAGPAYYGGGYYGGPAYYAGSRCFYDYNGYYHCSPSYPGYYGGGYYGPSFGVSYYGGGWGHPWYGGGRGGWHGGWGGGWHGGNGHWHGGEGGWHGGGDGHGHVGGNSGGQGGGNHWHH